MLYKGIDLSKWQKAGSVNFKELKRLGYEFVILRAGYGKHLGQKDIAFEKHYEDAISAGLKVGAYHYSYATSVEEALQEAECFLTWIKNKTLEYPVAFDIEDDCQKNLSVKERTDIALAFMDKVEKAGYYTLLYSSASWLGGMLDMEKLKRFDTWVACYTKNIKNIRNYYKGDYGIWQHTATAVLPTVHLGFLDENYSYKNYAKIIKKAKLNRLPPPKNIEIAEKWQ